MQYGRPPSVPSTLDQVSTVARRPRILVLNQYYWPGVEATAHLLTELCEALAEDYDVEVVTGVLHGHEDEPRESERNGVRIVRASSTSYERSELGRRAVNYVSYLGSALAHALRSPAPDLVICMTDPPIVGDAGVLVGRRFGAPVLVISQDVFPEIATELGRLGNPAVVGVLRVLVGAYLRRADRIVAIGETMRQRLEEKGAPPERLRVIPNWVDTRAITPRPRDNVWAEKRGLVSRFVVMHSGNVGHAQDLDSLVRAATFLRDLDDLRVVIVGFGARHREISALARRLEVREQVRFFPYQQRGRLPLSLSSADLHVVGLAKGLAGYVVPSRLYGVLSAGRPVIAAADEESETARLVREVDCGIVIPPGRPELLARTIREAKDGAYDLEAMGRRGREYVEREADRSVAMERYRALVAELVGSDPSGSGAGIPDAARGVRPLGI
jgi:glycosyltransferase involved in cell wall biosynthesis